MNFSLLKKPAKNPAHEPGEGHGLVYISTQQLIQLRHAAQSLPLKSAKVRALQAGQYYSPFRGRGMEFDEVRLYQPGDDVRTLDWRVTARTGKAHTKLFREERERNVYVWVDFRDPMFFATRGVFKSVMAAKLAALLAWSAHHQRDRIGGLLFSDSRHVELKPRAGKAGVLHLLQVLSQMTMMDGENASSHRQKQGHDDSEQNHMASSTALKRLRRVTKPGSLIFMISDFRGFDDQCESLVTQLSRHNDLVLLFIHDPLEKQLPDEGVYRIGNGKEILPIDTSNPVSRADYSDSFIQKEQYLESLCKRHGLSFHALSTTEDPLASLQQQLCLVR